MRWGEEQGYQGNNVEITREGCSQGIMTIASEYRLKLLRGRSPFAKCKQTLTVKDSPINLA